MTWLVDPVTREPLPAFDARHELGPANHVSHFVPEYEDGIPVRMRWVECPCPACEADRELINAAIRDGSIRDSLRRNRRTR